MTPAPEPTVFTGGRVYTSRRYARAVLVENGTVVAVGTEEEVRRATPTGAERVDLAGRLLVPGLADPHLHVGELARQKDGPDLANAGSVERLLEALHAWAEAHGDGPLVARGFDLAGSAPSEWPHAATLDRGVADRPVVVYDRSGHVALLNTVALERLHLPRAPAAGEPSGVLRDPAGAPTGVLVEEAMRRYASTLLESLPASQSSLRATIDELLAYGLTSIGAMSVGGEELAALRSVAADGRSPSFRCWLRLSQLRAVRPDRGPAASGGVRVVGVKAFLDGAFGPHTAALLEPYDDLPSTAGVDAMGDSELRKLLDEAVERGFGPALHAIGDRAVERAARLLRELPSSEGIPPRIEHASLTPPRTLDDLRQSRAHLVVQPGFVRTDHWLAERLGPGRARWAYPFRTLIDQGASLSASSDAPFCPPDPWWGMEAAVQRRDASGRSANAEPSEAIPVEEAFGLYAERAHRTLGIERGGTLEPGAPADLLVLRVPSLAEALKAPRPVAETWVGGVRRTKGP